MTYTLAHRTVSQGTLTHGGERFEIVSGVVETDDHDKALELAERADLVPRGLSPSEEENSDEAAQQDPEIPEEWSTLRSIASSDRIPGLNGNSSREEIVEAIMALPPGEANEIVAEYSDP
ncbi:hypothetical protein [Natronococcus roseus]|uniref:hypothetical protein n=1 Tax=Natronococcus roseus TaxID=1052014 RepID=UPI00374DC90D